ncbi:MAG: hypothetical protein PVG99_09350 [Desulfobacteraceae bacterium]
MRSYFLDEIPLADIKKARTFLEQNTIRAELGDIFWVRIPDDLLNHTQFQHRGCQPHVFAIELGEKWIKMEFFIRSLKGLRCECQAYCTPEQIQFILNFAHHMLTDLAIRT